MARVKICGIRRAVEAEAALAHGAAFLGFVFYPPSPRNLTPDAARELLAEIRAATPRTDWGAVGVFVNEPAERVHAIADECGLDYVQLHGTESSAYCREMRRPVIKALRLTDLGGPAGVTRYAGARLLLDSQVPGAWGGTGVRFDWAAARPYASEALIAGGLTPANVCDVLDQLQPWGLDVSSGVERDGWKDPALIQEFLERACA